jgi:zinc protease
MFRGSAKGGEDQFTDSDAENLKLYDSVISSSGLGNFSSLDLQKALAGKQVSVSKSLNVTRHNISGVSTPKDIETMMQLVYLNFTNVSKDQKSYDDLMQRYRLGLKNAEAKPDYIFSDTLVNRIYCGNKKNAVLHLKDLDKVSYERVLQMDKQLYTNAGNFTFYFVGNYDEATLRPLIEQYIASLPGVRSEVKQEETRTYFKGIQNVTFRQKMESPKPIESEIFYGVNTPYTAENKVICSAVGQVLSMDLFQKVREEASATYSIYASCYFNLAGKTPYTLMQIQSPITEDAKVDTALVLIDKVLEKEAKLMTPESVEKVKSVMLKQADVDAKTNGYWLGIISDYLDYGVDNHTDYKKTVRAITPNQLSDFFVKAFYTTGNHLRVVMRPETK